MAVYGQAMSAQTSTVSDLAPTPEIIREIHYEYFKRHWPSSMPYKTERDGLLVLLLRDGKLAHLTYKMAEPHPHILR